MGRCVLAVDASVLSIATSVRGLVAPVPDAVACMFECVRDDLFTRQSGFGSAARMFCAVDHVLCTVALVQDADTANSGMDTSGRAAVMLFPHSQTRG